jgi:peptide subunit release factor 1 (eRF1)
MAVNLLTQADLRALTDARPERGRVLSVFLNLDPTEFASAPARATAINSVLNEAEHAIDEVDGLEHDEILALREDLERIRGELNRDGLAADGTRGVAIYACGLAGLFEVLQLPQPVQTQAVIERTPFVRPLVQSGHEKRWGVVLVNRRSARLFRGRAGGLQETDRIEDDVHRQHMQGGWSQARYQRSVDKEAEDHLKHVAEVLFDTHKHEPFDALLVGAPEETVSDMEAVLHPYLRERIKGHVQLDVEHSSPEDVQRVAGAAIQRQQEAYEQEILSRLDENLGRNLRAASGFDDVLAALNQARVEILVVSDGLQEPGSRDPLTGMLGRENSGFASGAAGEPVENLVEAAIEKAIEQSAEILVVRDPETLVEHGGIAALLRF